MLGFADASSLGGYAQDAANRDAAANATNLLAFGTKLQVQRCNATNKCIHFISP
jgi:hypothetical protein